MNHDDRILILFKIHFLNQFKPFSLTVFPDLSVPCISRSLSNSCCPPLSPASSAADSQYRSRSGKDGLTTTKEEERESGGREREPFQLQV